MLYSTVTPNPDTVRPTLINDDPPIPNEFLNRHGLIIAIIVPGQLWDVRWYPDTLRYSYAPGELTLLYPPEHPRSAFLYQWHLTHIQRVHALDLLYRNKNNTLPPH